MATQMNLPIPPAATAIIKKVNDVVNMLNVLKLTLRYEFVMVTADQDITAGSNAETAAKAAVATIPGYAWAGLSKMDKTGCWKIYMFSSDLY